MSASVKEIQAILESALVASRSKEHENNKDFLMKHIKEHIHYNLLLSNINKKFNGKETPIHWLIRQGCSPALFDVLETLSKEETQKEVASRFKITTWVKSSLGSSSYDLLKEVSDVDGSSIFLIAVQTGNLALVKHLISKGVDLNAKNSMGMNALHIAAETGNNDLVQFLIESCSLNPYEADSKNRNIFYIAEVQGDTALIDYLQFYAFRHKLIHEVLQEAIKIQDQEESLTKLLKDNKAQFLIENINQKFNGYNAVQLGLRMGANVSLVGKLLGLSTEQAKKTKTMLGSAYNVVNDIETQDGYALLHIAAKQGRNDIVDLLLQNKADINLSSKYTGRTPVLCAIQARQPSTVDKLLSQKKTEADVNVCDIRKRSALIWAIKQGQIEVVRQILEKSKAQAAYSKFNPLGYVAGAFDMVTAGDTQGRTPLHYAARLVQNVDPIEGSDFISQLIKFLEEQKNTKAIDAIDNTGFTPLHYAIMSGNIEAVKLLVERGKANIDATAKGDNNLTPLLVAARYGHKTIVEYLISRKVDVVQSDTKQRGLFHQAVRSGNIDLVRFLLNHSATKNLVGSRDHLQRLPLHVAARLGFDQITKLIIEAHPEHLYAVDKFGETPIRSAYHVARTNLHDMRGDNLSTVDVLRTAMNSRAAREIKTISEQRAVGGDLDAVSKRFLSADQHQKMAIRTDLVTDLLQPIKNQDGKVSLHQVKILHEGKGFHCLVFVPENVADQQPIDLKIVFCTPSQTKDIVQSLQQLNKLDAVKNNMGYITQRVGDIVQQLKTKNPHSPINITVSGKGIGGDDAQYCTLALMHSVEKDPTFLQVSGLRLVTLNAPKVNQEVARGAFELAKKLKDAKRLKNIESDHLIVDGSLLPLLGESYLFGEKQDPVVTNTRYITDKKYMDEMKKLMKDIKEKEAELRGIEQQMRKLENEMSPLEERFNKLDNELKIQIDKKQVSEDTQKRHAKLKQDLAPLNEKLKTLNSYRSDVKEDIALMVNELKRTIERSLNLTLDENTIRESIPRLQLKVADFDPVTLYQTGTLQNVNKILTDKRPDFMPVLFSSLSKQSVTEHKISGEQKRKVEDNMKDNEVYKEFLQHAQKYNRGKSAFEQRYASGEYLYHHLAYQNLKEGEIIPVITDKGQIVNYSVHPIIHIRGMVAIALTPVQGAGEIKFLFRGTHDIDSAVLDLSKKGAGQQYFKGKERVILNRTNQILAAEQQRLRKEGLPGKFNVSIGGHSLGGATAQQFYVLLEQALAQNKYDRRKEVGQKGDTTESKEHKETKESKDMAESVTPDLIKALGAEIPKEIRSSLAGITEMRLQAYNSPGVSEESAMSSRTLAVFLNSKEADHVPVKLKAYYQRVNADLVQRAGQAHILTNCPKRIAEVEVLKFVDYSSVSKITAHTDKQFTREISGRTDPNLSPVCFERLHNDEQGKILTKAGKFEFENKIEPNSAFYDLIKSSLKSLAETHLQEPDRGTGRRM